MLDSCYFVFIKQKTAYEMRISDWSSDVCSSDLEVELARLQHAGDVLVVVHRQEVGARIGMAPRGREIGAVLRLQEADQGHLAHRLLSGFEVRRAWHRHARAETSTGVSRQGPACRRGPCHGSVGRASGRERG